ncbi:MAG: hypothetical protein K8F36_12660 [Melioribacteraceae bacterium]|nr:hypothetical protein [Melioribacteraceae bacterium]
MKLKILFFAGFVFLSTIIMAQNTNPEVSNINFTYNPGDGTITITYDLFDAEQISATILMLVSKNGGETFNYSCSQLSGDIYYNVSIGVNKTIIWNHDAEHGGPPSGEEFVINIIANDEASGGSPCAGSPVVNHGGKAYNTIQIGNQCWFRENLDYGEMISGIDGNGYGNMLDNGIVEKFCYDDNEDNCDEYGALYQWNEAVQYVNAEGTQGLCPDGWHVPTENEFIYLMNVVYRSNPLKAVGQGSGAGAGTNTSGFEALLAGYCLPQSPYFDDGFHDLGAITGWWTSLRNAYTHLNAAVFFVAGENDLAYRPDYQDVKNAYSVRCVKD